MDLYQFLFGGDIFTPIENSSGIAPLSVFLLSIAYIATVFMLFKRRRKLGSEYLPLLLSFFIVFELLMGEMHNPLLEDQYAYMNGVERLFWDRPLYVWLTFYLRYYGMLLLNLAAFIGVVYLTKRLCQKKDIDPDYPLLFLIGNPFVLFHVYWVLPEILITALVLALYYSYETGWEKTAFLLNIPSLMLKMSSILLTLPLSLLFLRKKRYLPLIGLGLSAIAYFGLKKVFLGEALMLYNPAVVDVNTGVLVNILNAAGNYVLLLSPLIFFLPSHFNKTRGKRTEFDSLLIIMTILILAGITVNYDYYWRYFLPLLPLYALKTPEVIGERRGLFEALLILNFLVFFPILAIWSCPVNISLNGALLCRVQGV